MSPASRRAVGRGTFADVAAKLADDRRDGIGAEVAPALLAEAVDRLDEADRTYLDEVVDGIGRPRESTRERVDEREVLLDHPGPGAPVAVTVIGRE